MCVTMLKQRCREHGVARWPYRKVKKLDTIIEALQTTSEANGVEPTDIRRGRPAACDNQTKLESVKRTRDLLITEPNSRVHLNIGKLDKTTRKRMASSMDTRGSSEEVLYEDERSVKMDSIGWVMSVPSIDNSPKRAKVEASEGTSAPLGGVLGKLLEAANAADEALVPSKANDRYKVDFSALKFRLPPSSSFETYSNESDQIALGRAFQKHVREVDAAKPSSAPATRVQPSNIPAKVTRPVPRKFNSDMVSASLSSSDTTQAPMQASVPVFGGFLTQAFWRSMCRLGMPTESHNS